MAFSGVRALVFDVSGVLRDSREVMRRAYTATFASYAARIGHVDVDIGTVYAVRGLDSFNDLRMSLRLLLRTRGRIEREVLSRADADEHLRGLVVGAPPDCLSRDAALIEALRKDFRRHFAAPENKDAVALLPGVERGLQRLSSRYALGVLSNSTMASLVRDLGALAPMFRFMVSDAEKPDPAVLLRTLRDHNIPPQDAAYIGDAVSDITLARRAGLRAIAMLTGMGLPEHLAAATPHAVCRDFDHLAELAMEVPSSASCPGGRRSHL
eukprot:TRINITY_DN50496_c0_g1_i1.p1 TRINITY_DN50496_c0_g1~~TRINITY_DN50496_c0_g1_i1.p1  ORF type:complete len:294 (+),score=72.41 TRINITY_DN50496_c0_g1_i1:81-884(+)